jgi:hypothetical protein
METDPLSDRDRYVVLLENCGCDFTTGLGKRIGNLHTFIFQPLWKEGLCAEWSLFSIKRGLYLRSTGKARSAISVVECSYAQGRLGTEDG